MGGRYMRHVAVLACLFLALLGSGVAYPPQAATEQESPEQKAAKQKAADAKKAADDKAAAQKAAQSTPAVRKSLEMAIKDYSLDGTVLRLAATGPPEKVVSVTVADQSLKDALKGAKTWKKGDRVIADVSVETKAGVETSTLMNLTPQIAALAWTETALTMLVTLLVFGLITWLLSQIGRAH